MSGLLLLVRHGVTDWNRQGRFQGHLDPPLSDDGRREARLLADRIAADGRFLPGRIVTSPLTRAAATAEQIAATASRSGRSIPVYADPRLMELGQGEWEGRTHAELAVDDAERYAAWRKLGGERLPPGGESIEEALGRVAAVLDEIAADGPWPVCVVSHGGALRLAARHLLRLEAARAWALDVDNAGLSVLALDGDWGVVRWNDTAHLLGREALHVDEAEGRPLAL